MGYIYMSERGLEWKDGIYTAMSERGLGMEICDIYSHE